MDHDNPQQHVPGSLPQPILDPPAGARDVMQQNTASQVPAFPQAQSVPPAPIPSSPVANEGDAIDAGWVTQVDNVIKQTVADPRLLSQEFARLKAQYIAGRYGREIKQADKKG